MALEALAGININALIATSWKASTKDYTNDHFHQEVEGDKIFFAFRPSFLEKDLFDPENASPFGETEMKQFPCMRSFSSDVAAWATVNEAFLKNLRVIISTLFPVSVKAVVDSKRSRRISGGLTDFPLPEPLCVTFGAPLVGDNVFKHALGRENWSRFFVNFVTTFDIVPRIMLAPKASTKQALPRVLSQLDPRDGNQGNDQTIAGFYATVMKDVETAARQAACELIGDGGNAFLETFSSFLELSPYRPAGTFVFSTGTRLVAMNNSDVVLQILFYASQSINEQELSQRPYQCIRDHHSYEEMLHPMEIKVVNYLDMDESALIDLGLSTSAARECVRVAFGAENKRVNQTKIETNKQSKIEEKLKSIDEYKLKCQAPPAKGYYDSFKQSDEHDDFDANVIRAKLAGSFDDVLGLLKKGQLPDEFEGSSVWIDLVTRYRRLMEPLDIANYHRHLKNEDTGRYMEKGRPKRYKHAQRLYEHGLMKAGRTAEEIRRSDCGSCFWAEVEELRGKKYDEAKVKKLEEHLEGWIRDEEVDKHIFLEGSTFRKWWHSLPEVHRSGSSLRVLMG
ncbi:hypothetical protein Bca101_025762 [Brassica carinata]